MQDLKEYFRRPRLINTGTFSTGSKYRQVAVQTSADTIFSTWFPSGKVRLAGVQGVRFRMVFTLQTAATPFHQGVVALNWQYACGLDGGNYYVRNLSSVTSTQIPHVRLDLSQDTMVQLSVPFMHPYEYLDLYGWATVGYPDYGFLGVNVILNIGAAATITPPTYKLYVHLEDLELFGALPQSLTNTVVLQSGRSKAPVNEEFENDAYPLSSGLHAGSRVFKWIAKGVPMLSSLASTPEWFLGKAAALARFYGYAKPQIQDPVMRVANIGSVGECNIDLPSATVVAGPYASNALRVDGTFSGSDVDEMALSYVLSQWSQVCTFNHTTTDAANAFLYAAPVSPCTMWYRSSTVPACNLKPPIKASTGTLGFLPSNLFFFSSMFRNWKGGFKFRFTFAKTKFHAGRVMVTFVPRQIDDLFPEELPYATSVSLIGPETQASGLSPFGYTAIFDLKDSNVFEFKVPYVSPAPWLTFTDAIGSLTMTVVDPLVCPSTVSTSVNVMVEVCADSDFELAVPLAPMYAVCNPRGTSEIRFQSGRLPKTVGGSASQYTMGESINSLKQLIMIPKVSPMGSTPANTVGVSIVMPWWYKPLIVYDGANPLTALPRESFSFGGVLSAAYTYVRGGTDVHVYTNSSNTNSALLWSQLSPIEGNAALTAVNSPVNRSGVNVSRVWAPRYCPLHVRIPGYSRAARIWSSLFNDITWFPNVTGGGANIAVGPGFAGPEQVLKVNIQNVGTTSTTAYMNRSAADDAMLGLFIGAPPLALTTVNTGTSYDPDSVGFN